MDMRQKILILIIIIGGIAVLASYVFGLKSNSNAVNALWGGVPEKWRGLYTVSMFVSALSYFVFSTFILFKLEVNEIKIFNSLTYSFFLFTFSLILIPSALWMPLSLQMLENPRPIIWMSIRIVLTLVGLASFAVTVGLILIQPKQTGLYYWSSVVTSGFFAFHTGILDAILWPYFYK